MTTPRIGSFAYPPSSGGRARRVVELAVDHRHGKRGERDQREREVDREDRTCDELVRVRHGPDRVARLLGEIRDGLDTRVREHRDRDRDREVRPRGRDAPVDVVDEDLRAEDEREADDHEQDLRREVDDCERDRELRRLLHADHVQRDEHDDHDRAADDVPRVRVQRLPEDGEVVGDEERRHRHGHDVHEHLRPAGREAHDLVEGMPGEAGRAARLREAGGALGVGRSRRGEDHAGHDEDERGQPERVDGSEPERVVDRGADVAVGGCEERGRAEHALHLDLTPTTASRARRRSLQARTRGLRRELGFVLARSAILRP